MIRITAKLTVGLDSSSDRFRKGDIVAVDGLKLAPQGLMFRVVNVWKHPEWFHSDWFVGVEEMAVSFKVTMRTALIGGDLN